VTGRLFRLQGTAAPMRVQRRVKELLGEREPVARSARYVLRAFADWGVIVDSARKGEYSPSTSFPVTDPKVATWLLETAVTSAPDGVTDFHGLVNGPCLFPFQIGGAPRGVRPHGSCPAWFGKKPSCVSAGRSAAIAIPLLARD
jgi:hypothetical protein